MAWHVCQAKGAGLVETGVEPMALIRIVARIDAEGKIQLPRNLRLALGLKEQDVVELKVVGSKAKQLTVSKRTIPRRHNVL